MILICGSEAPHRAPLELEAEHRIQMRDWIPELVIRDPKRLAEIEGKDTIVRDSCSTIFSTISTNILTVMIQSFNWKIE